MADRVYNVVIVLGMLVCFLGLGADPPVQAASLLGLIALPAFRYIVRLPRPQ